MSKRKPHRPQIKYGPGTGMGNLRRISWRTRRIIPEGMDAKEFGRVVQDKVAPRDPRYAGRQNYRQSK